MKKKLLLPLVIAVIVAGIVFNAWHSKQVKLTGTLELTEHSLGARVGGRIGKLFTDEGQTVKKGELLATLDRYEKTGADYQRTRAIYQQGGVDTKSLEDAQLAFQDQQVISPIDGVVLVKVREAGEVLQGGSPVVVVGDRSVLWVKVFVPERLINRVRLHDAATVSFDGIRKSFRGHVSFVAPQAEFTPRNVQTPEERVTQTFAVKVVLDDAEPYLRPGVAADVILDLTEKK